VYDSEAIFTPRARARKQLHAHAADQMSPLDPADLDEEIALAKLADVVIVVSRADCNVMREAGVQSVAVICHALSANPTSASFEQRDCFLFIGAMHGTDNPNADSIRYFYREHWPKVHRETAAEFLLAGYGTEQLRTEIADPSFRVLGARDDLRELYERARVVVVPTRYAAGVPFKAHEAAAQGVPMVVSPIIASQLRWIHERDYLAASDLNQMADLCIRLYRDRDTWNSIRTKSLARVAAELSPAAVSDGLQRVLEEATRRRDDALGNQL
jgi:glycosyltransferase involved in cell wall biosynthesis